MKKNQFIAIPILFAVAAALIWLGAANNSGREFSLPGFSLIKPVFAQGAPEFPDLDAGLSAYARLGSGEANFEAVIDNVFTEMLFAGDNYIIGVVRASTSSRKSFPSPKFVDVRVYADTDGLVMGYLPKDKHTALIFDWDEWDANNPIIATTLEEAMEAVAQAAYGKTIAGLQLSWYDWAHPDATHILIAAKSINRTQENLFVSVPSGVTVYGEPTYSFHAVTEQTGKGSYTAQLITVWPTGQNSLPAYLFTGVLTLGKDAMYTFSHDGSDSVFSDLGIVIVYAQ
jgi:hypothetical protein